MDWWLLLALFLYFVCAFLIVVEIFVPSGGIISIISLGCLVGGLMIFFKSEMVQGWWGIVAAFIEIPIVLVLTYKIFPHTKFAKSVLLSPPKREVGDAIPDSDSLKNMLGETGIVITPLRPVGMVNFEGKRIECVAESGYVDKDKNVKVIKVESSQLTVRVVKDN